METAWPRRGDAALAVRLGGSGERARLHLLAHASGAGSQVAKAFTFDGETATVSAMKVKVLYFAAVADLLDLAEEELHLPEAGCTVAQCKEYLLARHPELTQRMRSVRIARNEMFADDAEIVTAGDVLAIIPPVAGG